MTQTLRFTDVSSAAGILPVPSGGYGHGASFGDYDGDGRPDIYAITYAANNLLYRNNGNGTFTDIAAAAGVQDPAGRDRGMASADYDNDGDLDIYIMTGSSRSILYRNNGNNTFSEVTQAAGVNMTGQGQGVAWGDYDNDGLLDLFVTQTVEDNCLFRQNPDHTFSDVTLSAGIGSYSESLQPVFFDVDLDGDLDLFVTRKELQPNLLYLNNGNGTFTEQAAAWGIAASTPHSQGAAVGDYDRDGDFDVYVCSYDSPNLLFRNNGRSFTEVAASAGVSVGAAGNRGALFADFDDDGWLDLYVTRNDDNRLFRNNGDGTFSDVSAAAGVNDFNRGYSPSCADYDGDGDLDIFFTNTGQNSVLYRNDGPLHHWLQIDPVGGSSNRDGVGARLTAWSGGQKQVHMVIAGQAYLCTGSDLTVHFGLGASLRVDSLIIQWPAGIEDRHYNIAADQKLVLREGEGTGSAPPDTTPPLLADIQAGSSDSDRATITWTTDEASDSQVEYGLTTGYGMLSQRDASRVTAHAVTLTGLAANTTYHYRVKSADAHGNVSVSGDFTFTTSTGPLFSDDFSGPALDSNKWVKGSHAQNTTVVENGYLRLRTTGGNSGWVHTRDRFSGREKAIAVKVVQPNNDAALGMSPTVNSAAANGFYDEPNWYRFYNYRNSNAEPYKLYVQWRKNGVLDGRDVASGITFTGNFYLRLRTSGAVIFFEYSFDRVQWTTAYQEVFALPGYTLDDLFVFELSAYNTPAKGDWLVDDFTIHTLSSSPADTTPPVLSNIASSNISTTAATITWTTDEASDAQVEYGLTDSYGLVSPLDGLRTTSHAIPLVNLTPGTRYHYRVKSRDAAGNLAVSADFTFTTADSMPDLPLIANLTVSDITDSSARVTFDTDRFTYGTVEYDTSAHGVIRVMPLGDSITEGEKSSDGAGYRSSLYHRLTEFGSRFDFVGSLNYGTGFPDTEHEGHPGWTANQLLGNLRGFLEQSRPQAVLLHIGTNDISGGNTAEQVVDEITAIVDEIFAYDASIKLHLSTLIPRTDSRDSVNLAVNARLPGLVQARVNAGYRMSLVDNYAAFVANPDWETKWMADRLHPNDAGYRVMTGQWFPAYSHGEYDFYREDSLLASSHSITLTGLTPGTTYHYRARARDLNGAEVASADFVFTTAGGPDSTAPQITNLRAGDVTAASASISWETNEPADSQVEYGLTTAYGNLSTLDTLLVTGHHVTLSNLQAGTRYHYRVRSRDAAGNLALSADSTFITAARDTTPLAITNVRVNKISSTSAEIRWSTNEPADSQVDFDTGNGVVQSSPLDSTRVLEHAVLLRGLQAGQKYFYRVKSRDAAGNLAISETYSFTTRPAPLLADDFDTATLDTSKWRLGSHTGNLTAVVDSALHLRANGSASGWVHTRETFTGRNKIVQVKVLQPNNDGALGMSATVTTPALNGVYDEPSWYRFYNYRNNSNEPYKLYVQWRKNNVVDGLDVATDATFNGNFYLRLRTSSDSIYFEYSYDDEQWFTAYSELFSLTGHTLDDQFYFELSAYRTDKNGEWVVDAFAIYSTEPALPDDTPPVISQVAATAVTASQATITWNTDESSDSQVEYGLSSSYGAVSVLDPALVRTHSVTLTGLQKSTTYHYRVISRDAAGNLAVSSDQTFTTTAATLSFTDITLAAGTAGPTGGSETGGHAAIFADVDSDNRPDLYITMYNVVESPTADLFFRNTGGNVFASEAGRRGIEDYDGGSHGAIFADLDNDGDFDLYNGTTLGASGISAINNLYRNDGNGFFTEVTAAAGLPLREWQTRSVVAFDMENDGDLDLFTVTDYLGSNDAPEDRNEVYRNDGGLHFTAIDSGALFTARAGQGALATDFDGDGDLDVFAANRTGPLNVLRNDGQGRFAAVDPAALGLSHRAGDGITSADVDNDGKLDLLLASDDSGHLYLNNGNATFRWQQSFSSTDGYMGGFADLDNDGDLDLVFAGDDVCYLNDGRGTFVAGPAIPVAGINDPRALGFADIDGDGDLDFAVGCKRSRNWLVRNDYNNGNWLKVRLISPQGVAGAFGATVSLSAGGGVFRALREANGTAGYLGQDDPILHFGLGRQDSVDLTVRFLDGTIVTASGVAANQTIVIDGRSADQKSPALGSVAAANISATHVEITWNTDEISDSQVEYGPTPDYGNSSPLQTTWVTAHRVALSGLSASTTYHYRVKSKDPAGNWTVSGDFTFTTAARDTLPPVISNVAAVNVTASSAVITWETNEAGDSQVEYGPDTAYGFTTPVDSVRVTSHQVTLTGLAAGTTYHYRAKSADAHGNLAVSGDFAFTTLAATLLADDFNSGSLDAGKWQRGANAGNQSAVVNGQLELRSAGGESGWVITTSAFQARNTTITVQVTQPNDDGALGMSPTYNLAGTTGIYDQAAWYRFYVYRDQASGPYLLYVQWKKNGVVDGVDVTGNLVITGPVYLRLRCDDAQIHFEASLDGVSWIDTYREPFGLPGYTLDSRFYYELAAYRTSSKGILRVDDFSISSGSGAASVMAAGFAKPRPAVLSRELPADWAVSQNYPNPFNLETRVNLALPEAGRVQAVIYDQQGREVLRLHDEYFAAGYHVLRWQGTNTGGRTVSSGIYLMRVIFDGQSGRREVMTHRLTLLK
ncbi:MAG: FG-GAP-like repeat-containing protein [candidate division KSB1 bacterium]|nr:FG-GAP-like repeat-containing protein [candidate division KSB1 bacterium]MDZ7273128.1 FG-GAP-like repeat-containing protein [candidate division KSB1 bacterium]MDZ7285230.1 FG-GAP-like repeat-containing protein [candidate division KSB1 bacterium]MDZ7298262.1 FG-GAP-like repeat-containing protein [candidate division KSB1 bacterium]MDZ7349105.1 FG-GAP-like repeat-containing protein [candidate division KSB1 bacterium]